jgi:hypothetical protein
LQGISDLLLFLCADATRLLGTAGELNRQAETDYRSEHALAC